MSYEYKFHSFIRLRRPSSTGYFSAVMYLGYVNINFVPTFKAELNFKIEFVTPPPPPKKKRRSKGAVLTCLHSYTICSLK